MAVAELQTRSLPSLPAVVVLFALAAVSATWQLAVFPGPALGRYFESVAVARSLAAGHGFANPFGALETGPTAHVAPLFPLALGGLMHLFGDPRSFAFAAIGLCVFLHGLHAVLLLPLSRLLLADVRPGVWAALFTAVVPAIPVLPQWESIWSATGSMLFCLATARILRSRRPFWIKGAASGALCGVLLLLNPALVIVSGAWMAAFWFCERPPLTGWLVCALTFLAAAALVCLPWTLRNQRQLGGLFLVRDNLGIELYSSNADCAQARGDANKESGCHALMQANFNVREAALLRDMGEVPYNRSRLAIAIAWIRGHPARFRELTRRRFKEFWFPTPGEAPWYAYSMRTITALSLAGLFFMVRARNKAALGIVLVLAFYPVVYYFVQAEIRFRVPILWMSLLPAGLAMQKAAALLADARSAGGKRAAN
ncbi:MAG: hypothetical protein LAP87_22795 [Acidobacteriia bacterium]|nr:hypothetical protein [Terriglobia bacterium]